MDKRCCAVPRGDAVTTAERDLLLTMASVLARLCDNFGRQIDAQDIRHKASAIWAEALRAKPPAEIGP